MRAFPLQFARSVIVAGIAIFLSMGVASPGLAQQPDDPPTRVGRLSDFGGEVFLAPDDPNADWQPIGLNYPVTVGDNVWSGSDGRAEIDFGAGHVRLSRETNVHFAELDDRKFSAYLASGRVILRLRSLEPGETAKFDTANVQVDILRRGTYRIEFDADGPSSVVVVREGEAELRTADNAITLRTGQTATISGTGYGAALVVRDGFGSDGLDAWSLDRDARLDGPSLSSQYVSNYGPGVRELDMYGAWEVVPTYGAVWYPTRVATDWVPYRDGSWTFVRPWGWTWVDSAPWGWAPFHYGRWVRIGPRWAWCPGEYVRRPVYAPALVAWYGGPNGTSWSVNFAGGPAYGWVPLAWGEPYWPHHRYSNEYWRILNRPYAVNVQRISPRPVPNYTYANMRIGAFTVAPSDAIAGRRPIASSRIVAPQSALAGASLTTSALGVRPIARPASAADRPRGAPAPASQLIDRARVDALAPRQPTENRLAPRPGFGSEPASRPPAPSVGGSYRQQLGDPAPMRPGAGTPPVQTPAPSAAPPMRIAPSTRIDAPEPGPAPQHRPAPREPAFQRPAAPAPAPQAAPPTPQYYLAPQQQAVPRPSPPATAPQPSRPMSIPAPQSMPAQGFVPPAAPAPAPAPGMRAPMPVAPPAAIAPPASPAPAPRPVPSQSGRPEPPMQSGPGGPMPIQPAR
jgi:hypothetical protein